MEKVSEAYDWQQDASAEPIICAYCGRKAELLITVARKQSTGGEQDLRDATHVCDCGARGVWSFVRGERQCMIAIVWTLTDRGERSAPTADEFVFEHLADARRAHQESHRLLDQLRQGLEELRGQYEQVRSELNAAAEATRGATADARNSAELHKTQSLQNLDELHALSSRKLSSVASAYKARLNQDFKRVTEKLAEVEDKLAASHRLMVHRLQEYETLLLDPLTRRMNAAVHGIGTDVQRIKETVAGLLANGTEPNPAVGQSLIVTEAQLSQLAEHAARETLSPVGIERLVEAYLDRRRASLVNRQEMIENLPGLFDVVEGALRSWQDPRRHVPSEEVRAAVVEELQQLWLLVEDWQRHNGIDRFPEPGAPLAPEQHELIADGSAIVAPSELPDSVLTVLKSGYRFRDNQTLLRQAWVTAKLKQRQAAEATRPIASRPHPDG